MFSVRNRVKRENTYINSANSERGNDLVFVVFFSQQITWTRRCHKISSLYFTKFKTKNEKLKHKKETKKKERKDRKGKKGREREGKGEGKGRERGRKRKGKENGKKENKRKGIEERGNVQLQPWSPNYNFLLRPWLHT